MKLLATFFIASAAVLLSQSAPDRLLVQTVRGAKPDAVNRALQAHGAKVQKQIGQLSVSVLSVDSKQGDKIKKGLDDSGLFSFVERDGLARGSATPNDPGFASQWHLPKIQAPGAWDITTGSAAVVAVVDSGVDPNHPDLAAKLVPGYNYLAGNTNTADVLGHGTWVAGTLGAIGNNGNGVAGVTWQNPIMPLVVLSGSNYAYYSDIASAITYAADHGVRIVNVSIGGTTSSSTLQSAIDYAWNKGTLVFAAAGNNSSSDPMYPASCNNAIAVSATDPNDNLAYFSSYGPTIDVSAPGYSIYTTSNGSGYEYVDGTSFASPVAAGVAALVLSANPSLSATNALNILEMNTDDLGTPGYDQQFGWGRVNAAKAVAAAKAFVAADSTAPSVSISSPTSGSTVSGTISVQGSSSDNVGVVRVEFAVDGTVLTSTTTSQFAFGWDSTSAANGTHSVKTTAYDAAGNSKAASVSVNVSNSGPVVADTLPPSVQITSPSPNSLVRGSVKVNVSATDNIGVRQVSIYLDGVQVWSGTAAPYTYAWNTKKSSSGTHTVSAKAWDAAGNMSTTSINVVE